MKAPTGTVMITPGDPHASGGYAPTVRVQAPDFKDASYESWKSQAGEHGEEAPTAIAPDKVSFPTAMQGSPALGMDHFDDVPAPRPTAMMPPPTTELAPNEVLRAQPTPETISPATPASNEETIRSKPRPPEPDFSRGWFGAAAVDAGDAETAMLDSESPEALETLAPVSPIPSSDDRAPLPAAAASRPDPGQASPEETAHFEAVQTYGASTPAKAMAAALPDFKPASPEPAPSDLTQSFLEHRIARDAATDAPHVTDPNLEVTSPHLAHGPEVVAAPELELTASKAEGDVSAPTDPALVTDASEMATSFPTRFGVPGAEPLTVGMAADLPELYAQAEKAVSQSGEPASEGPPVWEAEDASEADSSTWTQAQPVGEQASAHKETSSKTGGPPSYELKDEAEVIEVEENASAAAAEPPPAWKAFETSLNIHEKSLSLHQEMQQHFAKAKPDSGSEASAEARPGGPKTSTTSASNFSRAQSDDAAELAKAMAAAVGAEMAPAIANAVSESSAENPSLDVAHHEALIADIVDRVTERMKPHLTAEVTRELASELAKKKK